MTTNKRPSGQSVTGRTIITVIVTPADAGRFDAATLDGAPLLAGSRQPFLEAARVLLARGADPDTTLIMRHTGSATVALRGKLGAVARLTVKEPDRGRMQFAAWEGPRAYPVASPMRVSLPTLPSTPPTAGAILEEARP
jgi:hypothetical protein